MRRGVYTDIEIRGVVYSDVATCARAFGVTETTVRRAILANRQHRLGLGRAGKEPMQICIRGTVYADARAAAVALGVTPGAIWQALHTGRIDRVGLPRRFTDCGEIPFVIAGLSFSSMAAASRAFGFNSGYVSNVLRSGSTRRMERLIGAAMAYAARQTRGAAA